MSGRNVEDKSGGDEEGTLRAGENVIVVAIDRHLHRAVRLAQARRFTLHTASHILLDFLLCIVSATACPPLLMHN